MAKLCSALPVEFETSTERKERGGKRRESSTVRTIKKGTAPNKHSNTYKHAHTQYNTNHKN